MKEKTAKKANIISIRMSDEELNVIQKIMDTRNMKASFIMREALSLFREQWEMSRQLDSLIEH